MYILLFTLLFILSLYILAFIIRYINKYKDKEDIIFYKHQFIINKKIYDVKSTDFNLQVGDIEVVFQENMLLSAFITLEASVIQNGEKTEIKKLKNVIRVLKKVYKYNRQYYKIVVGSYFSSNHLLLQTLEKEVIKNGWN